jgi:hypothetical protein
MHSITGFPAANVNRAANVFRALERPFFPEISRAASVIDP